MEGKAKARGNSNLDLGTFGTALLVTFPFPGTVTSGSNRMN